MSLTLLYPIKLPPLYFPSVSDCWFGEGRGGAFRTTRTHRPCTPRCVCCRGGCGTRRRGHCRSTGSTRRSPVGKLLTSKGRCRLSVAEHLTTNRSRCCQQSSADQRGTNPRQAGRSNYLHRRRKGGQSW